MILLEDIDAVRQRYPNISDVDFTTILNLDPTYKDGSNSVGKYTKWLLNLFNKGKLELRLHIKDLLQQFEAKRNSLQNKDIGQFKSIEELEDTLAKTEMPELSKRQQLRQTQKAVHNTDLTKDAELVFESDAWEVWIPKTYEASCRLGRDTRWCTATTENDYYYDHYSYQGPLYINIHKHTNEKYQFHFESSQFMDAKDDSINLYEFLNEHESLKNFYFPIVMKRAGLKDLDDLSVTVRYEWLAKEISKNIRGDISSDFIESCMEGDLWDFFSYAEYYDWHYISEYGWSSLNATNRKILLDHGIDEDQFAYALQENDDLQDLFSRATNDAYITGSMDAAIHDFNKALTDSIGNMKFEHSENNDAYIFKLEKDDAFKLATTNPELNDIADMLIDYIAEDFDFQEPYYGWNEFDDVAYNQAISDEIENVFEGN